MINELWEWFIIGLVIAGISAGIVMLVIYIYLFTACCFIADKLAIAFFFAKNFASNSFKGLLF